MRTIFITLLVLTNVIAEVQEYTTTDTFQVKVGNTQETASCDVTITFTGTVVDWAGSSVDCSVKWKKNKALSYDKELSFTFGDLTTGIISATITINLKKSKNKPASQLVTTILSTETHLVEADSEFFPTTLWCPHNDYFVWGEGAYESIVDEAPAEDYVQCAQRCTEYKNEHGNAPCFSWMINNNAVDVHGLGAGNCRLLAYMNVSGVHAPGVQSGYHKCWPAMEAL